MKEVLALSCLLFDISSLTDTIVKNGLNHTSLGAYEYLLALLMLGCNG